MNNNLKPVDTLKPFTRFLCTIGELPTSYLISMTYEEQLVWFCNYLEKTVIPTINNNAEAVIELQNYVKNYFDNLDVQEEINNKLDDMAESGELEDIISTYLNINSVLVFDNVSDMTNSSVLSNGSTAKTLGYYSLNDDGGATYKIRTRILDDVIDNGKLHAIGDNLVAELISENKVNVKVFGAKGDGETDDTSYIQNAVNSGYDIYFPQATFNITDTININSKTNWNLDCTNARIEYSGINYAFSFKHIINSNLDFGVIIAENGGCISFSGNTESENSQYVNITFIALSASTNCINAVNTGSCWLNEFRISKGRFIAGTNGVYALQNSSKGFSHWVFNELGIEGVSRGFLFEVGSNAEANDRYITTLTFIECRTHENAHTIKTIGKVVKVLFVQARYMNTSQFELSSDSNDWKIIHADRTNYVHNGTIYENSIDGSSGVTMSENFNTDAMRVNYNDSFCKVQFNLNAKTTDITLSHDDVIATGFPKPKFNIYFIATTYGTAYEMQPRFRLTTNGELRAYYPANAVIHSGNYPTIINLTYPVIQFGQNTR